MKKLSLEETVELEKEKFDKRIKKLEEKRRKEEERKLIKEEKKKLKEEQRESKHKDKNEDRERVEKPKKKISTKQLIVIGVLALLLICLILSVTTTIIFANKFKKMEKKYDELRSNNEAIMKIINTDDGTGDKLSTLDRDLATMKSDIEDLRVSRDSISETAGNNTNEINALKAKVKGYDDNSFSSLRNWFNYNQKLSNQYNNYQNQMYYVCEKGYLAGKIPDGCPK